MPLAGRNPAKRSEAHLRWAERYAKRSEYGKAAAHLGRALDLRMGFGTADSYESMVGASDFTMKVPGEGEIVFTFPNRENHTRVYNIVFYNDLVNDKATVLNRYDIDKEFKLYPGEKGRGAVLISEAGAPGKKREKQMRPAKAPLSYEDASAAYSSFDILAGTDSVSFTEGFTEAQFDAMARKPGALLLNAVARTDAEERLGRITRTMPMQVDAPAPPPLSRFDRLKGLLTAKALVLWPDSDPRFCKQGKSIAWTKEDIGEPGFISDVANILRESTVTTDMADNVFALLDYTGIHLYDDFLKSWTSRSRSPLMYDLLSPLVLYLIRWLEMKLPGKPDPDHGANPKHTACRVAMFMFKIARVVTYARDREMLSDGEADPSFDLMGLDESHMLVFSSHLRLSHAERSQDYVQLTKSNIEIAANVILDGFKYRHASEYYETELKTKKRKLDHDSGVLEEAARVLGLANTHPTEKEVSRARNKQLLKYHPDKLQHNTPEEEWSAINEEYKVIYQKLAEAANVFYPGKFSSFGSARIF
jgi:hypothetical protein